MRIESSHKIIVEGAFVSVTSKNPFRSLASPKRPNYGVGIVQEIFSKKWAQKFNRAEPGCMVSFENDRIQFFYYHDEVVAI